MYCSEACRTQADNAYHRIECKMLPFYNSEDLKDTKYMEAVVAIRTLLIGTKQGTQLKTLMNTMSIQNIFEKKKHAPQEPFVYDYASIIKLFENVDLLSLKSNVDIAVKMIMMLRSLSFFKQENGRLDDIRPVSFNFGIM